MIYLKTFDEAAGRTVKQIELGHYGDPVIIFTDGTALALVGGETSGGEGFVQINHTYQ